ncbi:Aspartate aminotransferase [Roseimaritima multifibrata]|uniref:Aspartate aminotransferase n=2 Tax=Roseimaritima multifibrata TaxID=1930274 RepID=A0A517MJK1_9BACT|nr:Aspartate aminotransferase [Roseimaritima multifibrata]
MTEASKRGYLKNRSAWANFGQGAPEIDDIPNCPQRLTNIPIDVDSYEYAPVGGTMELREAVAKLYNERYRQGKKSQYTAENVAIGSGGRLALTRLVSTLGPSHIGHFLPDYTAYEELLGSFGTFIPIPISLAPNEHYEFSIEDLRKEILGKGLSTILLSNPSNPTGKVISGDRLKAWVDLSRELECAMLFDEFYSHYIYDPAITSVSAAEHIKDVNKDPIIVFDGLTKNWRYPGFRISWTLGPKNVIEGITSAGSFLDGGASHPIQNAAVNIVTREHADQEASAIKAHFKTKAEFLQTELEKLGIKTESPQGSFYCWGDLSNLPKNLRSGSELFAKAIENNLILVPGIYFDINPGKRRPKNLSIFENYARFSFGPSLPELELGISILKKIIQGT